MYDIISGHSRDNADGIEVHNDALMNELIDR